MKTTLTATLTSILLFVMFFANVVYAEDLPYKPGEVLIGVKKGITRDVIQRINAQLGAEIIHKFEIIDAYQLRLPRRIDVPRAIDFYKRQPAIEYAEPNYIIHPDATPNDPSFKDLWGLNNTGQTGGIPDADIDAPEAWDITTGSGDIVVASIDTGVDYNHEDLAANMWKNLNEIPDNGIDDDNNGYIDDVYGWDFHNNDNDPMDDHGHGTHISGTIGAIGNNDIGVTGVCWRVKIMALKFMNAEGYIADAIKCIQYAKMMGAHLSNNSWGWYGFPSILLLGAILKGPLFIASAGNYVPGTDMNQHYPSNYRIPKIISVAATDHDDTIAGFSNYGEKSVDLGAPGVNILSTFPDNSYGPYDGTSMAAPHVAGVAALAMAVNPSLSELEIKDCILNSVDPLPDLAGKVLTGGRLNAEKAVISAIPAAPPIAIRNSKALTKVNPTVIASSLGNAFPSPANPEVWIPYRLDVASDVTITIYNISGKIIRTLNVGHRPAGVYENKQLAAHWNGRNRNGEIVASGFYFYTFKAGDFSATRKLFILR